MTAQALAPPTPSPPPRPTKRSSAASWRRLPAVARGNIDGALELLAPDAIVPLAGKIAERWSEFDQLGMLQQLGILPAPGAAAEPAGRSSISR